MSIDQDHGSLENPNSSLKSGDATNAMPSSPDAIMHDAPERTSDLGGVVDGLRAPVSPSQIDPVTLEAPYTPLGEQTETETETQTAYEDTAERNRPWGKIAIAGGLAAAVTAGVFALGLRGDTDEPRAENPTPKPPTGNSAPSTPGATPSPSETVSTPEVSQRELFTRLQIPQSSVNGETLRSYVDKSALDEYVGVDGAIGLYPEVKKDLLNQELLFGQTTPEQFAAAIDRYNAFVAGSYYDVIDGKLVEKPNAELMDQNQVWRNVITPETIDDLASATNISKADATAAALAENANDSSAITIASHLIEAQERVRTFNAENPDKAAPSLLTTPTVAISSTYLRDVQNVDGRLSLAEKLRAGDIPVLPTVEEGSTHIVDVQEMNLKSADGAVETTVYGVSVVGREDAADRPIFSMTVAIVPAEMAMDYNPKTDTNDLAKAPKGSYFAFLVAKDGPR